MTHDAPAATAGPAWSSACATWETSANPTSSIGVPTHTTMRPRPFCGISELGVILPAAMLGRVCLGQSRLVERDPPVGQGIRPAGILLDQDDLETLLREANRGRDPDVPGTDDRRLAASFCMIGW